MTTYGSAMLGASLWRYRKTPDPGGLTYPQPFFARRPGLLKVQASAGVASAGPAWATDCGALGGGEVGASSSTCGRGDCPRLRRLALLPFWDLNEVAEGLEVRITCGGVSPMEELDLGHVEAVVRWLKTGSCRNARGLDLAGMKAAGYLNEALQTAGASLEHLDVGQADIENVVEEVLAALAEGLRVGLCPRLAYLQFQESHLSPG